MIQLDSTLEHVFFGTELEGTQAVGQRLGNLFEGPFGGPQDLVVVFPHSPCMVTLTPIVLL